MANSTRYEGGLLPAAVLVGLLHPVTLQLVLRGWPVGARSGVGFAHAADRAVATLPLSSWPDFAHAADAAVVVLHPSSWPALASSGDALLSPLAAALLVLVASWSVTIAKPLRALAAPWGFAAACSLLTAVAPNLLLARVMFTTSVVATTTVFVSALLAFFPGQRHTMLGGLVVAAMAMSLHEIPRWDSDARVAMAAAATISRSAATELALASVHAERGDSEEQMDALRRALSLAPRDIAVRRAVGDAYAARGRWNEAERHLSKISDAVPGDASAALVASQAAVRAGHALRARSLLARTADASLAGLNLDGIEADVLVELARLLVGRDRPAEAADVYAESRRRESAGAAVVREHAAALVAASRMAEAIAAYRDAHALDGDNTDTSMELAWLLATGAAGDSHEALPLAQSVSAERPTDSTATETLAAAQASTGDFAAAAASQARAIEQGKGFGDADWLAAATQRLETYRGQQPWREPRP